MSDTLLINREHLQSLLDAALAADSTGNVADSAYVLAAKESLSTPQEYQTAPEPADVRQLFEEACKKSKAYKFPLGYMLINGAFHHYSDSDTDSAFVGYRAGFNQGINWERRQRRGQPDSAVQQPAEGVQP
ncbi:hypothetical protein [Pseudomonas sp. MWU12-2323]|uniref:hypothetical protein n=1 Tax=Pseudomonas sp. MWU12-2323 TaxID=2651296 RepID=UPI00128B676F|nr:hypothetical protein [Pseudomonas sp. MWU12-2323]MPQ69489.1 hypothetical protein [Pseudomonas sp. MWU12-2323]